MRAAKMGYIYTETETETKGRRTREFYNRHFPKDVQDWLEVPL
jgi:hypothetical protein